MKQLGLQGEALERARESLADAPSDDVHVLPDNVDIVRVFLAMETQWRRHYFPKAVLWEGLRLESWEAISKGLGIKPNPEIFNGLLTMQAAALEVLNEKLG